MGRRNQRRAAPLSGRFFQGRPGGPRRRRLPLRPNSGERGGRATRCDRRWPTWPGSGQRPLGWPGAIRDLLRCLDRQARSVADRVRSTRVQRLCVGGPNADDIPDGALLVGVLLGGGAAVIPDALSVAASPAEHWRSRIEDERSGIAPLIRRSPVYINGEALEAHGPSLVFVLSYCMRKFFRRAAVGWLRGPLSHGWNKLRFLILSAAGKQRGGHGLSSHACFRSRRRFCRREHVCRFFFRNGGELQRILDAGRADHQRTLRSESLRHHHQQGPDPLSGRGSHGLPGRSRGHCLFLRPDPVEAGGRSAGGDRRRPARPGSRHRYVVPSGTCSGVWTATRVQAHTASAPSADVAYPPAVAPQWVPPPMPMPTYAPFGASGQ
jgi:hypothetical protein